MESKVDMQPGLCCGAPGFVSVEWKLKMFGGKKASISFQMSFDGDSKNKGSFGQSGLTAEPAKLP